MTAAASSIAVRRDRSWVGVLRAGAIAAVVALYVCLVGLVPTFNTRPLIAGVLSLGQAFLLGAFVAGGYLAAKRIDGPAWQRIGAGALAGLIGGAALSVLLLLGPAFNLRSIFLNASPQLFDIITLEMGAEAFWVPSAVGFAVGAIAAGVTVLPGAVQRAIAVGVVSLILLGLFAGLLRGPLLASQYGWLGRLLFASEGLTLVGAAVTLSTALGAGIGAALGSRSGGRIGGSIGGVAGGLVGSLILGVVGNDLSLDFGIGRPETVGLVALLGGAIGMTLGGLAGGAIERGLRRTNLDEWYSGMSPSRQRVAALPLLVVLLVIVLILPLSLGQFFAQVVALVAIYILMGLGLNITLGLAGLLDLGFVAFFAVGGYTVALLTSTGGLGIADLPFWAAVPFAVIFAFLFGAFLGLPILGIRGDYLAIATLGFGEIIRILSVSDLLRPILGGPQGITNVPRPIPVSPTDPLSGPNQIYYIALICAAIIAFVALRLRDSRIGRAWVAIREDEDVAEALGINLVQTKLLAYALGAAFAGLGGAVFVGLVGAMFPTSINLFVSINVAALIIVGGMGSIPGVIVGALFLIGLPELFREFSEYRFLFYGAALIMMMRFRPEGLLPSRSIKRELHVEEENVEEPEATVGESVEAPAGALYPPERAS